MKILLSAFCCAPGVGSEPGVGWGLARELAASHDVWVLTYDTYRTSIEAELVQRPLPRAHFVYIGIPWFLATSSWTNWLHAIGYVWWQWRALSIALRLTQAERIDLVHHVTYVNSWLPTWMGRLNRPFVWSAGLREGIPWRYLGSMSLHSKTAELVRGLAHACGWFVTQRIVPRGRLTLLSASPPENWGPKWPAIRFPLGALEADDFERLAALQFRNESPFRVVSIGRLLGLKGFALGLRAFALLRTQIPDCEYWIVGDGPERRCLHRLAMDLGCADTVRFFGEVSRDEVFTCLEQSDVVLQPSVRESAGYVLLEAMAAGKPVVCLDVSGPSVLVTNDVGVKVAPERPDKVVTSLYAALAELARHPEVRSDMSEAARRHVFQQWTWAPVTDRLLGLYCDCLG